MAKQRRAKPFLGQAFVYCLIVIVALWVVFPVWSVIVTSFQQPTDALTLPPHWIFQPTSVNYESAWKVISRNYWNSIIVASCATLVSMALGSFAAYGLARTRKRRGKDVAFWFLSLRMLPPIVVIIPLFIILQGMRLIDTHLGLIIVYQLLGIPFVVWVLRGFFMELPVDLEEAALVDGASTFTVLRSIVLPISVPALMAVGVLTFISNWNEFLFAVILTRTTAVTLPVGIAMFTTEYAVLWGPMAASGVMAIIPVLVLALLAQRYLIRGLTLGAVKGV